MITQIESVVKKLHKRLVVRQGQQVDTMGSGSFIPVEIVLDDQIITTFDVCSALSIIGKVSMGKASFTDDEIIDGIIRGLERLLPIETT